MNEITKIDDNTIQVQVPTPVPTLVKINDLVRRKDILQAQLDAINAQLQTAADLGVDSAVKAITPVINPVEIIK